ncbi:MAG TPA: hypothetical protein VF334_22890 [Polyangia bacterium]
MTNARGSILAIALFLSGCGTSGTNDDSRAAADGADECASAAAHVRACTAVAVAPSATCDRSAAEQLLTLDCATLASATRTSTHAHLVRTLDAIACAAGIVRACPMPPCTAPAYPTPSTTCSDYIGIAGCGGCQFYACREAEHACGASGYYIAYADKYCVRFLQSLRPRMSPAGQRFLDVARDCLMRYVDDELAPDDACDDVRARAFHSHVACYHDNGFCELPATDQWLLINTVDPADFDVSAALQTAVSCL